MAAITPVELKKKMDNGHVIILDVREPFEYKDWHIPGAVNVPVSSVMRNPELEIPKESEIIAVCSHGIRSASAVRYLNMAGFNARSLAGGMVEWNGVYDFIEISEDIVGLGRYGKTLTVLHEINVPDTEDEESEQSLIESWTPRFKH